jgi:predicted nucleic-acid-binding protein
LVGIDTNILVRYLADDDAAQSALARELLERRLTRERPGHVCAVVLAELAWVLRRLYAGQRAEIADAIEGILTAPNLVVEHKALAWKALQQFRIGSAGYSDCLIAAVNAAAGCETTLTFDRQAARSSGFRMPARA